MVQVAAAMLSVTRDIDGIATHVWAKEASFCRAVASFIKAVDERGIPG